MAFYPLTPEKLSYPSATKAEDYVKDYLASPPWQNVETGILCFSPLAAEQMAKKFGGRKKYALGATFHFFEKHKTLLVSQFGMGAPAAVIQLEYLKVFSVKRVFSLGLTGGLNEKYPVGTGVFIQEAFRDEGCSYHYLAAAPSVKNPHTEDGKKLTEKLKLTPVKSWTTDAPFRETQQEFEKWTKKELACVEMEASALMAAAGCHSLPLFCLAVISDFMKQGAWHRGFSNPSVKKRMLSLLEALLFDPIE